MLKAFKEEVYKRYSVKAVASALKKKGRLVLEKDGRNLRAGIDGRQSRFVTIVVKNELDD
jgi:hypothetical protein